MIKDKYKKELAALLENEDKVSFFTGLISDQLWKSPAKRKEMLDFMVDFCRDNGLDVAKAWMYYYLAWHYNEEANNNTAIDLLEKAKDIFIYNDCIRGLLFAYNGLIFIYCDMGQHETATTIGTTAIAVAEENKEKDVLLKILLSTSLAYYFTEDYAYSKNILDLIKVKYSDDEIKGNDRIIFYKLLLEVELNLGNVTYAKSILSLVEKMMLDTQEIFYMPELLKLKGLFYLKAKDYSMAESQFKKSDIICTENKFYSQQCENLLYWAMLSFETGNAEEACEKLSASLSIAEKHNYLRLIRTSSYRLFKYYDQSSAYKPALEYLEKYISIDEHLSQDENMLKNHLSGVNIHSILLNRNEALSIIGKKIISTFNPLDMITEIREEIKKLVPFDFFGITLYDAENERLMPSVYEFDKIYQESPVNISSVTTFSEACIKLRKPIVIKDITTEYKKYVPKIELKGRGIDSPLSLIFLPLMVEEEIVGILTVQSLKANAYTPDNVITLKIIGSYIALSLRNSLKYKKIEDAAIFDSLTGFLVKKRILEEGADLIRNCISENRAICLAMVDIDNFKDVNDGYGHLAGDKAISQIASAIKKSSSKNYLIGRYGGDEFLIIAPDTNLEEFNLKADTIRREVKGTKISVNGDKLVSASISLGICQCNPKNLTITEAINLADKALYEAKNKSKNVVVSIK